MKFEFCNSFFNYNRFITREVKLGGLSFGGNNPVRIQSMTNTFTGNISETVDQCKRIFDAGADLVRITTPSLKDIENLRSIKIKLLECNYKKPISADVHFTSEIAERAAYVVDKVRINPGNFVKTSSSELTGSQVLARVEEKLIRLLDICRKNNTAIRIGTNHGSLSNRILQKYGDTPEGMVESTMEYLRIIRREKFENVIISLKSSNVLIMVQANRMLIREMVQEEMNYPVHLGVTEAGEGEDGRIKSAVGIGTLLQDGIGDTIRVSLTEDPENEIPVCETIVNYYSKIDNIIPIDNFNTLSFDPYSFSKQKTVGVLSVGDEKTPIVIGDFSTNADRFLKSGKQLFNPDQIPDFIYLGEYKENLNNDSEVPLIIHYKYWKKENYSGRNIYPILNKDEYLSCRLSSDQSLFLKLSLGELSNDILTKIRDDKNVIIISDTSKINRTGYFRAIIFKLKNAECHVPVIVSGKYPLGKNLSIITACDFGPVFIDGLADGIMISSLENFNECNSVAFGILQATRARITKTEYISCPGCGRTLFNLLKISSTIRDRTSHLKGIKIGIMGCIVNGPGEMADADFGYVGSLPGKITLYRKKVAVKKNIPEEHAIEELVDLIKASNLWIDPPVKL